MFSGSLASYGGPTKDSAPVLDPTVDRGAAGLNQALSSVGGMTLTAPSAWVMFSIGSGGSPTITLLNSGAVWSNGANALPSLAYVSTGVITITFPSIVFDDIPTSIQGFTGQTPGATPAGFAVNLIAAWGNCAPSSSSDDYDVQCVITSANVVTVYIRAGGTRTLTNATSPTFAVFAR